MRIPHDSRTILLVELVLNNSDVNPLAKHFYQLISVVIGSDRHLSPLLKREATFCMIVCAN